MQRAWVIRSSFLETLTSRSSSIAGLVRRRPGRSSTSRQPASRRERLEHERCRHAGASHRLGRARSGGLYTSRVDHRADSDDSHRAGRHYRARVMSACAAWANQVHSRAADRDRN